MGFRLGKLPTQDPCRRADQSQDKPEGEKTCKSNTMNNLTTDIYSLLLKTTRTAVGARRVNAVISRKLGSVLWRYRHADP